MAQFPKYVKIIQVPASFHPPKKQIKAEVIDNDDLEIQCQLCTKVFCNEVATRNHLRMEHSGVIVNLQEWVDAAKGQKESKDVPQISIKEEALDPVQAKTQEILSSMQETSLMQLASSDVSYIIIKSDQDQSLRKKRKYDNVEVAKKMPRRDKDLCVKLPVNGPFECMQPSTLVTDKTCHQIFFSCCEYSKHFREEHTRRRKATKCQVCEKLLTTSLGEEPTSPFPCNVCGMDFHSQKDLTEHTNKEHVKLKPFECEICHKRFTQQGGVQQHMRSHTGDRPFPCAHCAKAFTQKSGLDQHLRTHTKIKPYRCVICGKNFIQSVHLKQHMRTHTNITPFQCVVCEKKFKQSSHLKYHLKNHSESAMTETQREKYNELVGLIDEEYILPETSLSVDGEIVVSYDREEYVLNENNEWAPKLDNN